MQNRIELPFDMPSECVVDCGEVDADRIYYSSVAAVDNYYYSLLNSHYAYVDAFVLLLSWQVTRND